MCGIIGAVAKSDMSAVIFDGMKSIAHRGPDGFGTWKSEDGVYFGHTRLAILDLSQAGAQPMKSRNNNLTITFNGEIYNHDELRKRLDGVHLVSSSDTEVLVEHISQYGLLPTLELATGMFAFGLYDKTERSVFLARDRFGEKPLYVAFADEVVAFSSDLRALKSFHRSQVDRGALAEFMRLGYVPGPKTVWKNCWKIPPGTVCKINVDQPSFDISSCQRYFRLESVVSYPAAEDKDVLAIFEDKFDQTVKRQMVADVPVGAFLSGGIDSTLVVSSMVKYSSSVKTFTIGIKDQKVNESIWAKKIADRLGTEHYEVEVSSKDVISHLEDVVACFDEPFSDPSQLPMWVVARMAREHVKVVLTGDAMDEVFCGYATYRRLELLHRLSFMIPRSLSRILSNISWFSSFDLLFGKYSGYKIRKLFSVLSLVTRQEKFDALTFHTQASVVLDGRPAEHVRWPIDSVRGAQLQDICRYLPDDILVKGDRTSMAHGLECRVPMLDKDLMQWSWALPARFKVRHKQAKWILKQVLFSRLPKDLIERPKQGFGLPLQKWLSGDLKLLINDFLSESNIRSQGILDSKIISKAILEHDSGYADHKSLIWNALILHIWLRQNLKA